MHTFENEQLGCWMNYNSDFSGEVIISRREKRGREYSSHLAVPGEFLLELLKHMLERRIEANMEKLADILLGDGI